MLDGGSMPFYGTCDYQGDTFEVPHISLGARGRHRPTHPPRCPWQATSPTSAWVPVVGIVPHIRLGGTVQPMPHISDAIFTVMEAVGAMGPRGTHADGAT